MYLLPYVICFPATTNDHAAAVDLYSGFKLNAQ
ncbi:Uncharacterised protein [Pseudescherichia vulneris]|nr:Uncharacterised protein [Pseudescherichia vulneris]